MTTVFALALLDPRRPRRPWFLGRGATLGNLMRTSDPATARTWPTIVELELWIDGLPESAKEQIADRELCVIPLGIEVGASVGTITLHRTVTETADPTAAPETASAARQRQAASTAVPAAPLFA